LSVIWIVKLPLSGLSVTGENIVIIVVDVITDWTVATILPNWKLLNIGSESNLYVANKVSG